MQRKQILAEGGSDKEIRRMLRDGWVAPRPGAFVAASDWQRLNDEAKHRALVIATLPKLDSNAVMSHASAAVMHGLPILGTPSTTVHVTYNRKSGGSNRLRLHTHVAPLSDEGSTIIGEVPVTSVARTVLDCACTFDFAAAVAVADNALHRGLTTKAELELLLSELGRRVGCGQARRVLSFADGRSESPGESWSRVVLWQLGLPTPDLQFEVRDHRGVLAGRSDFAWKKLRTLGEYDGGVKYGALAETKDDLRRVLLKEREREMAMVDQRWEMVRWGTADLTNAPRLGARIRATYLRAQRFC